MSTTACPWIIESLDKRHDRKTFTCEHQSLTDYIRKQAGQDRRRDAASVFVAVPKGQLRVAGYYTLSTFAVDRSALEPAHDGLFAPYQMVNATLLGRLARDVSHEGSGLGEHLLIDALTRAARAAEEVASAAVIVEAIDAKAAAFYRHMNFHPFADNASKLYLPVATIRQQLAP